MGGSWSSTEEEGPTAPVQQVRVVEVEVNNINNLVGSDSI